MNKTETTSVNLNRYALCYNLYLETITSVVIYECVGLSGLWPPILNKIPTPAV